MLFVESPCPPLLGIFGIALVDRSEGVLVNRNVAPDLARR